MFNLNRNKTLMAVIVLSAAVTYLLIGSSNWNDPWIRCTQTSNCHNGPIDWAVQSVDDLTLDQITAYLSWTNKSSCRLALYFGGKVLYDYVDCQRAVCLDMAVIPELPSEEFYWVSGASVNGVVVDYTKCLVYSFGIHNEWSFDEDMEKFGCHVYSFDPAMNSINLNRTSKIHFYNLGLGDRDETWHNDSKKNWTMKSLDSIYNNLLRHQGKIIDYLKIDIEFSEFIALPQILASGMMDRVRQLGVEVHLDNMNEINSSLKKIRDRVNVIKSLEDYGLVRFDSLVNPWAYYSCVVDGVDWTEYTAYDLVWYNPKLARN